MASPTLTPNDTDTPEEGATRGGFAPNLVGDLWSKKLDAANPAARKLQEAEDDAADFDDDNGDASDDISDLEGDVDEPPRQDDDDEDDEDVEEEVRKVKRARESRKMSAKFLGKRGGATGGVIGLLIAGGIGASTFLAPASLLANLHDLISNHTNLGKHLFMKTGNSYLASILKGEGRDCANSKIKCKFMRVSEKRLQQWEKRGITVIKDGPGKFGMYKVRGFIFPDGTEVRTIRDFKALRYNSVYNFSLIKRLPVRAMFINKVNALGKSLKTHFKLSIADKFRSIRDRDKKAREEANKKVMNSKIGAPVDEDGKVTLAKVEEQDREYDDKKTGVPKKKNAGWKNAAKNGFKGAGIAATPVLVGCAMYNVVRATQAAMILEWHAKLIPFMLPFLQAGAQIKEQGDIDWQTTEFIADRLTHSVTEEDVKNHPDVYTEDMIGKTAMDAKGMDAVINGSYSKLDGTYAETYTGWAPANAVLGSDAVKEIQDKVGKQNIRIACKTAQIAAWAGLVACTGPQIIGCAVSAITQAVVTGLFADDLIEELAKRLSRPALELIAKANLSADLAGPPLGQALVSGAGVMAGYSNRAAGWQSAGTTGEVIESYNDMLMDDSYIRGEIAEGQTRAKENQFDVSNKYSFASQFLSKFSSIRLDGSLYSSFANIPGVLFSGLKSLDTANASKDGLFQPIEAFDSVEKIRGTLKNCTDSTLNELKIPCSGESGITVPYIAPEVEECMQRELNDNGTICVEQAIDYLSKEAKYKDGDKEKPYIDEETGEPSDWGSYKKESTDHLYKNPFLNYMNYCGLDRVYPPGYSDAALEEEGLDWFNYTRCAGLKSDKDSNVTQLNKEEMRELGWMAYYYNACISLLASEEEQEYCWQEGSSAGTTGGNPDVCALIDNPNVEYVNPQTKVGLQQVCDTGIGTNSCGQKFTINPELVKVVSSLSSKYKILVNNFGFEGDRFSCDSGQHPKGNAIDINGIEKIGGGSAGGTSWGSINFNDPAQAAIVSEYASDWLAALPSNRGGVGQLGCGSFKPTFPAGAQNVNGAAHFADSCDHLHIDIRDRNNLNGI